MVNEDVTNVDVAIYALYILGGNIKKIPTEEIAVKCYKISPSRFSWRLFPKYPDIETVRIALFDARKEKNGKLVEGRYGKTTTGKLSDGWILTPAGIKWIEENDPFIKEKLGSMKSLVKRTEIDRRIHEMEDNVAFKKFCQNNNCDEIKEYEFTDFLYASLDTPSHILKSRIDQARALAASAKRVQILHFLDMCEDRFHSLLK